MAGRYLNFSMVVVIILSISSSSKANNPNGTNPFWVGPSGEVVDMFSGELIFPTTDISIPARGGMTISFTRTYNSELYLLNPVTMGDRALDDGSKYTPISFSEGWHLPSTKVIVGDSMIVYPNGNYEEFFLDPKSRKKTRQFGVVTYSSADSLKIRYPDGSMMHFGDRDSFSVGSVYNGRYLKRIYDTTNRNWLEYSYYGGPSSTGGLLRSIKDPWGRFVKVYYKDSDTLNEHIATALVDHITYNGIGGSLRTIYYSYTQYGGSQYFLTKVKYPNGDSLMYQYSNKYYNDSDIGHYLLKSVTYPTGAKVRYCYENFEQRIKDCDHDTTFVTSNFAVKYVIFEENGSDVDTVKFVRTYVDDFELKTQYASTCDDCTSGQKTVKQFIFYGSANTSCEPSTSNCFGLLKEVREFKGSLSAGIFQSVSANPSIDDYWELYDTEVAFAGYGWDLAYLGMFGSDSVNFPYLKGYQIHIANTDSSATEFPLKDAAFDPWVGRVTSFKSWEDSVWSIQSSTYDTTSHRYLVNIERFDGFDTKYLYDGNQMLTKLFSIATDSLRDSIGVGYSYDSYGNVEKKWDNLAIGVVGHWLDSTVYDTTNTYPIESHTRFGLKSRSSIEPWLGLVTETKLPTGAKVSYYYDDLDRLRSIRRFGDADTSLKVTYYGDNRVSEAQALAVPGSPSTYRKFRSWSDIWGRAVADTTFDFPSVSTNKVTRAEYNVIGQLKKSYRPWLSNDTSTVPTVYKYDFLGRMIEIDSPNTENDSSVAFANVLSKKYFALDVTTTSWDGKKNKSRYDKYGRVTDTYFDSTGGGWTDHGMTQYLGVTSLPIRVISPAGDTITYTYDKWRNVRSITKKDEGISYSYFDKLGNLRFTKDANGLWTFFQYDSLSRLTRTGIAGSVTASDSLINVLNYNGSGTTDKVTYFYGDYDSPPTAIADSINAYYGTTGTGYDTVQVIKGMITQVNDEACKTFFVYDQYGRVISKMIQFNPVEKWSGAYVSPGEKIVDYKYNVSDQIEQIRYPEDTSWVLYQYLTSGLLRRIPGYVQVPSDSNASAFVYKAWGAVSEMRYANYHVQRFQYDSLSRVQKITSERAGWPVDFGESYVYHHQDLTKVYKDSLVSTLRSGPVDRRYYYDYRGRLDSARYAGGDTIVYYYDSANNRRAVYSRLASTTISDNLYPGSNRLKNQSDSYTDTTTKFTYDANGNMLLDLVQNREYKYDYRNMIDTLIQKYADYPSKLDTILYAYNYKNQRVMKLSKYWYLGTCSEPGGGGEDFVDPGEQGQTQNGGGGGEDPMNCPHQAVKATFYVWSGDEVIAEYNISDELVNQYIIANGERIARVLPNGSILYLHHDRQGSLRMTSISAGTVVDKCSFDAFGELISQTGAQGTAYTYTGQEWDEESGVNLFYLRNRHYNPSIGRFVTPDPLVSDLNPYSYCNNNPVMMSDPRGLSPIPTGAESGRPNTLVLPPWNPPGGGAASSNGTASPYGPAIPNTPINPGNRPALGSYGSLPNGYAEGISGTSFQDNSDFFNDDSHYQDNYAPWNGGIGTALNNAPDNKYVDWPGAAAWDDAQAAKQAAITREFEKRLHEQELRLSEGATEREGVFYRGGVIVGERGNESTMIDPTELALLFMPGSLALKYGDDAAALIKLAKQAKRFGISEQDARTLLNWADEYGVRGLDHINETHWLKEGVPHIHIGPVDHIRVIK